jgi:hypothetical protein
MHPHSSPAVIPSSPPDRGFRGERSLSGRRRLRWVAAAAGITAATWAAAAGPTTPAELLERARQAHGGATGPAAVIRQIGKVNESGMEGDWDAYQDLASGELAQHARFSDFEAREVWSLEEHWRQDYSGGVHPLNSASARREAVTERWLGRRGYLHPDAPGVRWGQVERKSDGGHEFAVVRATPEAGQPVELWFDAATGLLSRIVRTMSIHVETTTLTDYRPVGGAMLPFHLEVRRGDDSDRRVVSVAKYDVERDRTAARFGAPVAPPDARVPARGTSLPMGTDGFVSVEARLNGRGPYAFIVDTGGHNILTPAVAGELGITPFGAGFSGGAGAAKRKQQYGRLETVQLGEAEMRNQVFTVLALPYGMLDRGQRPPYAGILGLELFERFRVTMQAKDQRMMLQPADAPVDATAHTEPLTFSDDMPLAAAALGESGGTFALDTGNSGTLVVHGPWAENHGLAAGLRRGTAVTLLGMGGSSQAWMTRVPRFAFGGHEFSDLLIRYSADTAGSLSSRTEAGNVGWEILSAFDLTFDYARGRLECTWRGAPPPPLSEPAGLGVFKVQPGHCLVVSVVAGSAAEEAGLRIGDEVVSVGPLNVEEHSIFDLRKALARAPGEKIEIAYRRNGTPQATAVVLRPR